jgi:hypothetical protein
MKAFDGSQHMGSQRANAYNVSRQPKTEQPSPEPMQPEQTGAETESPEQTLETHGAAHTVNITHDSTGHNLESHHHDGHVHKSKHGSRKEAHDAGATVGGANGEQDESQDQQEPEADNGGMMPEKMSVAGLGA